MGCCIQCLDLSMCDTDKEEKTNATVTVNSDRITSPTHEKTDTTKCACKDGE